MVKKNKEKHMPLAKVIYFDEGSVTDFIQITEGGELTKTTELLSEKSGAVESGAEGTVSVGISGLFRKLVGIGTDGKLSLSADASLKKDSLVKTILQNTILTDFLDEAEKKGSHISVFDNIEIKVIKDSLSYVIMISPYLKMFKGEALNINTELDLSIDMIKMDESIRLAKGYFEFEGVQGEESVILRFNIDSFRNNYKISDLLKMDLTIYAVPVGKVLKKNISIVSEVSAAIAENGETEVSNPKYGEDNHNSTKADDIELKVYDVLLAGVKLDE